MISKALYCYHKCMKRADLEKHNFLSPTKVLEEIGLESGDVVIDYAAGAGHWVIPAAKIVAPKGLVYAIDNDIEILQLARNVAGIHKVGNIEIEEIDIEKANPKFDAKADLVILSNILFQLKNKKEIVGKLFEMIKPNGKLLVVEWSKENFMFGPLTDSRLKEEEIMTICERNGFKLECTVDAGWHHVGLVFVKDSKEVDNDQK